MVSFNKYKYDWHHVKRGLSYILKISWCPTNTTVPQKVSISVLYFFAQGCLWEYSLIYMHQFMLILTNNLVTNVVADKGHFFKSEILYMLMNNMVFVCLPVAHSFLVTFISLNHISNGFICLFLFSIYMCLHIWTIIWEKEP